MKSTAGTVPPSAATATPRILWRLSAPLVGLATAFLVAGVVSGGVAYLRRSPIQAGHSPGTAAWWPHLGVFVLTVALVAAWWRRRTRSTRHGRLFLLAPLGKPAARRLRRTVLAARYRPAARPRLAAATALVALLLYLCWRVGHQVLAGLDPNFTVNAWGGPTYLGAMACHYLDMAAVGLLALWLLDRLLLPDEPQRHVQSG